MSPDKPTDKFIEDQKNKNTLSKTRRDVCLSTPKMKAEESRKSRQKNLMNISVNLFSNEQLHI